MKINSIYPTISGEVGVVIPQGHPCLIIRTQGCNLKCSYCDAPETQDVSYGNDYSIEDLMVIIQKYKLPVLLTGGEPLLQRDVSDLIQYCVDEKIPIQIETNGTYKLPDIKSRLVSFIVDHKFGQVREVDYLHDVGSNDYVKFVVQDNGQLVRAHSIIMGHRRTHVNWAISPVQYPNSVLNEMTTFTEEVARYLIVNKVEAVINIQIHKLINFP